MLARLRAAPGRAGPSGQLRGTGTVPAAIRAGDGSSAVLKLLTIRATRCKIYGSATNTKSEKKIGKKLGFSKLGKNEGKNRMPC